MNFPSHSPAPQPLTDSQRVALVTLLTDDDPGVYQTIRQKLLAQGVQAKDWLKEYSLHDDPVVRRRTKEIIQHFDKQAADNRFLAFCISHGEHFSVEQACWLLAQTEYPDINIAGYQAVLDDLAGELMVRIDFGAEPTGILSEINKYLFKDLGFKGNDQDYYDPKNSYLNQVLNRKLGNPISLCLLYLFIARRLRLPVAGIGMPGHFICRFQSSIEEVFIDAFNGGRFWTKAECVKHLIMSGHSYNDRLMDPVSARRILIRICSNLHQIYVNLSQPDDSSRFQRYIVALTRTI
jgi:regulator of sirC expression with transglutaminase-like and TPR domain